MCNRPGVMPGLFTYNMEELSRSIVERVFVKFYGGKMKKELMKYGLCLLCFGCLCFSLCRKEKEEQKILTVCTEEELLYDVEEMVRYFQDSHNNSVDIQITYLPSDSKQRSSICKKWRAQFMAGKGADIYIMKDYGISRNMAVSEEEMLFPDPNKLLTSGVFLELSEYVKKDKEFQHCFEPIMRAGAVNEKQYIVPFTFNVTLLRNNSGKDTLALEDCTKPLPELLEEGKLKGLSPASLLFYVKDWIGNSFDYQNGKVMFSQEDVKRVLEYSVKEASKNMLKGDYEVVSIKDNGYLNGLSDRGIAYNYLPFPSLDGRFSATVLSYGAISRTCREPELAYEFLKVFWSENFVSGEGLSIPNQQYSRRYGIDTIFRLGGITVRQDQWYNWYKNKPDNKNASMEVCRSEENMISTIEQISTARFICTIDYLGMEIRDVFWKEGTLNVDKEGIQDDIQRISEILYNSTRYVVME